MREVKVNAERLTAFSDAVFVVIVTIVVLEIKAPERPEFPDLLLLWPMAVSYAMSYVFIGARQS